MPAARRVVQLLALLWLAAAPAAAQVNIETYRGRQGVAGAARFSVSGDYGNVDVVRSDGAGNLTLNRGRSIVLLVVRGAAGFLGGKRYANSGVVHLRGTWRGAELLHPEAFVQGDYDRSRRLQGRTVAGLGGRWNLLRGDAVRLAVGTALMWERERLDVLPADPHPGRTSLVRASSYLNLRAGTDGGVTLSATGYCQPRLTDAGDARWLGTAQLETPLFGPLTQTTVVDFRVDRRAPQGVKGTDVRLSATFGVRFGD